MKNNLPEVNLDDLELRYDEELNALVDQETGESFPLPGVSVTAAEVEKIGFQFQANESAIERLTVNKKSIDSRIKARKRRADYLRLIYLEPLKAYAAPLLGGLQSVMLGYVKVGFRKSPGSVKILPEQDVKASAWLLAKAPHALDITLDVSQFSGKDRIALLKLAKANAKKLDPKTSRLEAVDIAKLPKDVFEVTGQGEITWSIS